MTRDWETLLPLLVHIQANLEGDLSLAALSRKSGLSPFHLQRRFKAMIGEAGFARVSYRNFAGGIVAIHSGWRL